MSAVLGVSLTPLEVWLMMVAWQENKDVELLKAFGSNLNVTRYSVVWCDGRRTCIATVSSQITTFVLSFSSLVLPLVDDLRGHFVLVSHRVHLSGGRWTYSNDAQKRLRKAVRQLRTAKQMDPCTLYPAECHWLAFLTMPHGKVLQEDPPFFFLFFFLTILEEAKLFFFFKVNLEYFYRNSCVKIIVSNPKELIFSYFS